MSSFKISLALTVRILQVYPSSHWL